MPPWLLLRNMWLTIEKLGNIVWIKGNKLRVELYKSWGLVAPGIIFMAVHTIGLSPLSSILASEWKLLFWVKYYTNLSFGHQKEIFFFKKHFFFLLRFSRSIRVFLVEINKFFCHTSLIPDQHSFPVHFSLAFTESI